MPILKNESLLNLPHLTSFSSFQSPRQAGPAHRTVCFLRLLLLLLSSLIIVSMVSRVVTLKAYCRLQDIVQLVPDTLRNPWKHCSSTRMSTTAVVGVIYAIIAIIEFQAISQLEASLRRQYAEQEREYDGAHLMSGLQRLPEDWRCLLGYTIVEGRGSKDSSSSGSSRERGSIGS